LPNRAAHQFWLLAEQPQDEFVRVNRLHAKRGGVVGGEVFHVEGDEDGRPAVDGRGQLCSVALALSTCIAGMLLECSVELCAESIDPSSTCAQLQAVCIFTMLIRVDGEGAQAGGAQFGMDSRAPI